MYWAKVPSPYLLVRTLDVLTDMILHSKFDPVEVDKERQVIIARLHMSLDSPSDLVGDLIDEVVWPISQSAATCWVPRRACVPPGAGRTDGIRPGSLCSQQHAGQRSWQYRARGRRPESARHPSQAGAREKQNIAAPAADNQSGVRMKLYSKDTEQGNLMLAVPRFPR